MMSNKYLEKIAENFYSQNRELALHNKEINIESKLLKSSPTLGHRVEHAAKTGLRLSGKAVLGAAALGGGYLAAKAYGRGTPEGQNAHKLKALVSPAWQESVIAKEHGKKMNVSKLTSHVHGTNKINGAAKDSAAKGSIVGGAIGATIGTALAFKNKKHLARMADGVVGFNGRKLGIAAMAGGIIGSTLGASYKGEQGRNRATEERASRLHAKYASLLHEKIAGLLNLTNENKKDISNTATIGASGAITGAITNRLLHPGSKSNLKAAVIGGGLGLIGDYAAVKLNKHINNRIDQS